MRRISLARAVFAGVVTASVVTIAQADVYKSVDAQGQVHYSDVWSPGAQLIKDERNHLVIDPNANADGADQKKPVPNDHIPADAAKQAAQKAVDSDMATARAALCKRLQDQYDKLIHARRVYQPEPGPNGERQVMTDTEADAERVKTKQAMDEACSANPAG